MAKFTELPQSDLESIIAEFNIGELNGFLPASNGLDNSNYYISALKHGRLREYVLTLIAPPNQPSELLDPLTRTVSAAGLPVAPLIADRQGNRAGAYQDQARLLTQRLKGRHVFNPTIAQCASVGRFLARFHLIAQSEAGTAKAHPFGIDWLTQAPSIVQGHVPYTDAVLIQEATKTIVSTLKRTDCQTIPSGVIHGDLFRDNVLFNERGLSGVLDFHDASLGYWLFDLAIAVNDWCTDNEGVLDSDKTWALVRSYHQIRPLVSAELWFFPVFLLYASVTFWLVRLSIALRSEDADLFPFKNPAEFQKISTQHASHFFYLDQRLLQVHDSE